MIKKNNVFGRVNCIILQYPVINKIVCIKAIAEADRCARRLSLAQRLIKALGSENERWASSII